MKKRSWIILIGVIILIVAAFLLYLSSVTCIGCKGLCDYSSEYKKAINENNENICQSVQPDSHALSAYPNYDIYCREVCLGHIAIKKNDSSICAQISNVKNDSNLGGSTLKDSCYNGLAKNLNQPSLCNLTETNWAKQHCPW